MFKDEEDEDGLGAVRGCMNAFIIMVIIFMIIGTIVGTR